jgi:hypothetical protein
MRTQEKATGEPPIALSNQVNLQRSAKTSWVYLLYGLFSESQWRKLRNRRVPNGTHGGVRGQ